MPKFRYTAYTSSGELREGELEARSNKEALSLLNQRGLLPSSTRETTGSSSASKRWSLPSLTRAPSAQDYADLTRELATLVSAQLPLDESLRLMTGQSGNNRVSALTNKLLTSVVSGTSLSDALAQHAPKAPPVMSAMLRAGEARGNLGPSLSDLARFLEARVETQSKISAALTYPIILTITAVAAMAIIMTVLIPALLPLFEDTGLPIPTALALGNTVSILIADYWPLMLAGLALTIISIALLWRMEKVRQLADRATLKLPLIGPLAQKNATAMFARTLGTLLRNGVSLIQALQVSASVIPNRTIAAAVRTTITPVQEGKRIADVLATTKVIPETALRFIAIGEETSRLDDMLLHMADLYDKETSRQLDRVMTLLTPAITIVIGIAVGGLILSVMQAILSVNDLALQ